MGNNDDFILFCCFYYCKDKVKDFMFVSKEELIWLLWEVVLLIDDWNLCVKVFIRNVFVWDILVFFMWV